MKKLAALTLITTLVLSMAFILAACGGGDAPPTSAPSPATESTPEPAPESTPEPTPEQTPEPEPEETPVPEPEPITPASGVIEGNTYRSEFLGIQLDLSDEWIVGERRGDGGVLLEELGELPWRDSHHMAVFNYDEFNAHYPNMGRISIILDGSSAIDNDFSDIDGWLYIYNIRYGGSVIDFDPNQTPVKIGNFYYSVYSVEDSSGFFHIEYISITNGFIIRLNAFAASLENAEEIDILSLITEYP